MIYADELHQTSGMWLHTPNNEDTFVMFPNYPFENTNPKKNHNA
jgi:hypothetical protein